MIAPSIAEVFPFPKSARLLTKKDFRFSSFAKVSSENFLLVRSRSGSGRLGISISKKVLRNATARNRVKRLVKEAFRLNRGSFEHIDLHVIGSATLQRTWRALSSQLVQAQLLKAVEP